MRTKSIFFDDSPANKWATKSYNHSTRLRTVRQKISRDGKEAAKLVYIEDIMNTNNRMGIEPTGPKFDELCKMTLTELQVEANTIQETYDKWSSNSRNIRLNF